MFAHHVLTELLIFDVTLAAAGGWLYTKYMVWLFLEFVHWLSVYVRRLTGFQFRASNLKMLEWLNPFLSRRLLSPPLGLSHAILVTKMFRRLWAAVHQSIP